MFGARAPMPDVAGSTASSIPTARLSLVVAHSATVLKQHWRRRALSRAEVVREFKTHVVPDPLDGAERAEVVPDVAVPPVGCV